MINVIFGIVMGIGLSFYLCMLIFNPQSDDDISPWLLTLISKLKRQKKAERQKLAEAAFICFSSVHGQLLLQHLLQDCFYDISHIQGNTPQDTAFNEGQRALVKLILDLMNEYENPPQAMTVETEAK